MGLRCTVVPRLIILVWLTTFVLFDSIKFELICSFDKHSVDLMISAPVAEHQLLVFLIGQPRTIFRPLRKKFSFPGFFIILFFATCLSSADAGLLNFLLGIDPSTYRRKLMAEIYLAILVVYHDLTLLLYYLSYFTVSTNQKFQYIIFHQIDQSLNQHSGNKKEIF